MKKKALGMNPLHAYLASNTSQSDYDNEVNELSIEQNEHTQNTVSKKQRITIHLPLELIEKIKNVVFWEPGFTLTAFAQDAFEKAVHELEKERGKPYQDRATRVLKGGRPLS